jgi:hypothetical protein
MIQCTHNLSGGLGNQLFQVFTTIALAMKLGVPFTFKYCEFLKEGNNTKRSTYWDTIFKQIKKFTYEKENATDKEKKIFHVYETCHSYNEIIITDAFQYDLIVLNGYYQSFKYFKNYYKEIYSILQFDQIKENSKFYTSTSPSISMHFRLGDYKYLPDHHPILGIEYYIKSLELIFLKINTQDVTILYCHEDEDYLHVESMIVTLKTLFPKSFFQRISGDLPDWEQLFVMSLCDHNIIANSTFSLWAAYINTNVNNIVCYPSLWFGNQIPNPTYDMFPDSWFQIQI